MACLRLSKSSNEHEAALAAARAQEIIDRYQLAINDLDFDAQQKQRDDEPIKNFGYNDPLDNVKYGNYRESWTLRLATVVAEHNGTRTFWCKNGYTSRDGISIRIVGKPSDVDATRYLYSFFKGQIESLQSSCGRGQSSTWKGEFATGCIDTLRRRLKEQREATINEVKAENAGNPLALMRVQNAVAKVEQKVQAVDKWIRDQFDAQQLKLARENGFETVEAYNEHLRKLYGKVKVRLGRGMDGAGARRSTGGREAGQQAGHNIRLTGARGSIGSGRREINN